MQSRATVRLDRDFHCPGEGCLGCIQSLSRKDELSLLSHLVPNRLSNAVSTRASHRICASECFSYQIPLFLSSFPKLGFKQHCNSSLSINFLTIDDATIYKFVSVAVLWVQCLPWRTRTSTTRPRHNRIAYLCGKPISYIPSKTRNQRVLLPSTALRSSSTLAIGLCARWIADLC
jgi:hypothetical protein